MNAKAPYPTEAVKLRELRRQAGFRTIAEAAQYLGVKPKTLEQAEAGWSRLGRPHLATLASCTPEREGLRGSAKVREHGYVKPPMRPRRPAVLNRRQVNLQLLREALVNTLPALYKQLGGRALSGHGLHRLLAGDAASLELLRQAAAAAPSEAQEAVAQADLVAMGLREVNRALKGSRQ